MLGSLLTLLGGGAHVHTVLGHPAPNACGDRDRDESSIKCCSNHRRRDAWGGPAYTPLADINRYQSDLERVRGWKVEAVSNL